MADSVFILTTPNPLGLSDVESRANSTFVDIDGDSDLDGFVNNVFFENKGIASNPIFAAGVTNPFGLRLGDKPAFVDIDGDGDLDAFGSDYTNSTLLLFKNTGTAINPIFASEVANPYGLNGLGSNTSLVFVDIDGDGDFDGFAGEYHGSTLFFRNTGTASSAVFAAPVSALQYGAA
ncbi:FG-GAP-like repeat-containing protein [Nitrosomonas sp.]|uniref:FG-GAP-like repeat-containing protein n=1 Tax=Nitrosomonas sp. TaxID=42353 RepID=UPI00374CB48C